MARYECVYVQWDVEAEINADGVCPGITDAVCRDTDGKFPKGDDVEPRKTKNFAVDSR